MSSWILYQLVWCRHVGRVGAGATFSCCFCAWLLSSCLAQDGLGGSGMDTFTQLPLAETAQGFSTNVHSHRSGNLGLPGPLPQPHESGAAAVQGQGRTCEGWTGRSGQRRLCSLPHLGYSQLCLLGLQCFSTYINFESFIINMVAIPDSAHGMYIENSRTK